MKICCIFNIAPAYRKSIFSLIKSELDADIYSGDHSREGIAQLKMEPHQRLGNIHRGTKLIWQRRAIRKAFSKRYDAYLLTGNAGILSNWVITIIARLLGRKVYLWTHGLRGDESRGTLRKNLAYFRLAGNVILYGDRAAELLRGHGITNITVIYNSLDYAAQLEIRKKTGDQAFLRNYFGNDLPTICYLGRLTPAKRLDMLLRAMQTLECNLVIVGSGTEFENLAKLADKLGINDRVWFYGESYDEIFIGTLLTASALTVSPSSIGLTAIHSLTFGTPVVTHNHAQSQMPEAEVIIDQVTGYYYQQGDQQSLRDTIAAALHKPKNEAACHKIIDQKYNPEAQIKTLKKLFGTEVEHSIVLNNNKQDERD